MRATIESVSTCAMRRGSSRDLAIRAGRGAIDKAGRTASQLGILISAGIYRDENIVEPAMAPFIQHGLGDDLSLSERGNGTFSFDLGNGPCGFLTAIQVIDGFMQSGTVDLGLVVASDAHPYPAASGDPALDPTAAAVLLSARSGSEGFAAFHTRTFGEHAALYEAHVGPDIGSAAKRSTESGIPAELVIRVDEGYAEACVDCAVSTLEQFSREVLPLEEVDLVLPSQAPPGFARALGQRIGAPEKTIDLAKRMGNGHTASCAYALEAAIEDGSYGRAEKVLFVTVGAGITVAVGLYTKEANSAIASTSETPP